MAVIVLLFSVIACGAAGNTNDQKKEAETSAEETTPSAEETTLSAEEAAAPAEEAAAPAEDTAAAANAEDAAAAPEGETAALAEETEAAPEGESAAPAEETEAASEGVTTASAEVTEAPAEGATPSPEWVAGLPAAEGASQIFVVAGVGGTTAYISMHEKNADGEWQEIISTPGFIGKYGMGKTKEGDGLTPIGTYHFNAAFGIADDPGCKAFSYKKATDDDYWSGDQRDGYHYNEMVSIKDYPDLDVENSEHIFDYENEYQYCLNISWNEEGTPGLGSAIFLHCFGSWKPYTGGCIAIPMDKMQTVMQRVNADCVVYLDYYENISPEIWNSLNIQSYAGIDQKPAPAEEASSSESGTSEESADGMANPWSEVQTAEDAAEGAGVGYFLLPENGTEMDGGRVDWSGFQYMEHLAEADGYIGTAELTVRKGLKQESDDVSGDYTEYLFEWEQEAGDFTARCFGNEEGKMMKAVWLSDNFSYSIMVRGQGDIYDTYGIGEEDVVALISAIQ